MAAPPQNTTPAAATQEVLPSPQVLVAAAKIAIQQDKPIQLDYYVESTNGKVQIGSDKETKEQFLIRSKDEYTSNIQKFYKVGNDYIIATENSLQIVSTAILMKPIKAPTFRGD